jgi:stage V sporulation protein B
MLGSFLQGTLILLISSFTTRVLGFIYKVYIVRLIGAEGIGLYEMVFPMINLVLVATTAGIPVAVSKLVADKVALGREQEARRIFCLALCFLTSSGIIIPSLLIRLSPYLISRLYADGRVYWAFLVLIPAILLVSVASAFRGYYQGRNQMLPPAVSQLAEQLTRITVGIRFATWLLPYGIEFAAAGLALGTVCGEAVGLLALISFWPKWQNLISTTVDGTKTAITRLREILSLATPITLTRLVAGFVFSVNAVLIPHRLQAAGFNLRAATEIYGTFSGMAVSLAGFPSVFTISLAVSLVPAISDALARKQKILIAGRINQALYLTIIAALPFAVLFFTFPETFTYVFFHNREAAVSLKVLSLGCFFFYLQHTSTGILSGLGRMKNILKNALLGNCILIAGVYYLTGLPSLGIKGTSLAVCLGAVVICSLNILDILRITGIHLNWKKLFILPLSSAGLMAGFAHYLRFKCQVLFLETWVGLFWVSFCAISLYFLLLWITGAVRLSDFTR